MLILPYSQKHFAKEDSFRVGDDPPGTNIRQSSNLSHRLFLAFSRANVTTAIAHFISLEMRNFIDWLIQELIILQELDKDRLIPRDLKKRLMDLAIKVEPARGREIERAANAALGQRD